MTDSLPDLPNELFAGEARVRPAANGGGAAPRIARRRGRPELVSRPEVLDRIRRLAAHEEGLFRVHQTSPDLYARARRQFGSWAAAVSAAGVDYRRVLDASRRRAHETLPIARDRA